MKAVARRFLKNACLGFACGEVLYAALHPYAIHVLFACIGWMAYRVLEEYEKRHG